MCTTFIFSCLISDILSRTKEFHRDRRCPHPSLCQGSSSTLGSDNANGDAGHNPEMDVDAEGDDGDYMDEEGGESDNEVIDDPIVEPDVPFANTADLVEDINKKMYCIHSFISFCFEHLKGSSSHPAAPPFQDVPMPTASSTSPSTTPVSHGG